MAIAPPPSAPEPRTFRAALGRFATGVALVTAAPAGRPEALVVNSLASVSLDPPLVSFCPSRTSWTWTRMRGARRFAVNVLARHHEDYVRRAVPPGADRFAGLDWRLGAGGTPVLPDALAVLVCALVAEHPAGDHWIVVGRVEAVRLRGPADPLVFFDGAFASVTAARPGDAPRAPA